MRYVLFFPVKLQGLINVKNIKTQNKAKTLLLKILKYSFL